MQLSYVLIISLPTKDGLRAKTFVGCELPMEGEKVAYVQLEIDEGEVWTTNAPGILSAKSKGIKKVGV